MKFLVDAQLPPGLCFGLASRGHDAVHVSDVLAGETPDAQVAAFALHEKRVLITKDDDFARHHGDGLVILWLRVGNASNRALAAWLDQRWPEIEAALADNETLIEVR